MASTSPVMQQLIQIPIFRGLTESEAGGLLEIAEETKLSKGKMLFEEGDPGDAMYVVLEGNVEVLKKDRGGVQQQLAKMGDGSVLGEMSLVVGQSARSASVLAVTDLKLLKMPTQRFSKLVRTDNVGALKVVHNLAQVLSRRLQLMDEKLVDLMDKSKRREELAEFQKILSNWSF
jgi:CRP/FNR family transcriptional regulator, cyclic AMP receptor protein